MTRTDTEIIELDLRYFFRLVKTEVLLDTDIPNFVTYPKASKARRSQLLTEGKETEIQFIIYYQYSLVVAQNLRLGQLLS